MLTGGLWAAFGHNFAEMWLRWFPGWRNTDAGLYDRIIGGESYYTHAPIMPAVSLLIIVLLIRHTKIPSRPDRRLGGIVLGVSLLFHLVACLARVNFASGFAFIGVLAGLVLVFWGRQALRRLWFPIVLLLFMVPLPEVTIHRLNFELKVRAANGGVAVANALGVVVEQKKNTVFLPGDKRLVIANVCNGLRTLISLLAFGALYTYVCRLRGLWRIGLFAMTVPVAVVSNSLRILSLIVVADIWDTKTATSWFHDFSGILIFIVAFLLMFSLERVVLWARKLVGRPAKILPLFHGRTRGPEDEGQWSRMAGLVGGLRGCVVVGSLILVVAGTWWLRRTPPPGPGAEQVQRAIPDTVEIHGRSFRGHELKLDSNTLMILENPSYILRRYNSPGANTLHFCVIFSKDNRKGTHPPEVCLEGSADIETMADVVVSDVPDRGSVPCRELVVQSGGARRYFVYTYKCGKRYTRSFWVQQFVIFANGLLHRNASGALIRVSTPVRTGVAEARRTSMEMLRIMIPVLDKELP